LCLLHNFVNNPKVVKAIQVIRVVPCRYARQKRLSTLQELGGKELFTNFQLSEFVPEENLYRRLKGILQLDYLYVRTKPYYGNCGQKSIDPVVFFKLCLVGYLENIISDRQLMQHCSMRLDIRYFLNYKLTEPLPCLPSFSGGTAR
jgi:transposase